MNNVPLDLTFIPNDMKLLKLKNLPDIQIYDDEYLLKNYNKSPKELFKNVETFDFDISKYNDIGFILFDIVHDNSNLNINNFDRLSKDKFLDLKDRKLKTVKLTTTLNSFTKQDLIDYFVLLNIEIEEFIFILDRDFYDLETIDLSEEYKTKYLKYKNLGCLRHLVSLQ